MKAKGYDSAMTNPDLPSNYEDQMDTYRIIYSPEDWHRQVMRKATRRLIEWGSIGVGALIAFDLLPVELPDPESTIVCYSAFAVGAMTILQGLQEGIGPGLYESIREFRKSPDRISDSNSTTS